MPMIPNSKSCTKCDVEKPLEEFYRCKSKKFGRGAHCKVCMAEYQAANKYRGNLYMDKNLYDRLERLRAETEYKSLNALVVAILEQALAEIGKGGDADDAEK